MAQNTQLKVDPARRRADVNSVSALAGEALRVLAQRLQERGHGLRGPALDALEAAVRDPDPAAREVCLRRLSADGLSHDEIGVLYIPEVARRLGRAWSSDTMSFAEVTIGSARLQAMLREIADSAADSAALDHDNAASVVVMVLAVGHHTLGAMVLTGQLRRLGVSVRLVLGRPASEVAELLRDGHFDAVLILVALTEGLTEVRDLIANLREAALSADRRRRHHASAGGPVRADRCRPCHERPEGGAASPRPWRRHGRGAVSVPRRGSAAAGRLEASGP